MPNGGEPAPGTDAGEASQHRDVDAAAGGEPATTEGDPAEQVRELEERSARLLANWQRAQADLSNYRRQAEREREELVLRANAALVANLLGVLDDLERALDNVVGSLRGLTWVDGVWLIYQKIGAILRAHGVEELAVEVGQTFDPHQHQAVAEVEGEPGKVAAVVQKGYSLHKQLLRPAFVAVGRSGGTPEEEEPGEPATAEGPVADEAPGAPG